MMQTIKLELEIKTYDFDGLKQEAIVAYPSKIPAPGVIFIHGHMGNAYNSLLAGRKLLDQGYAVFLPSMLSYGYSQGKPDYCGPKTIEALYKGIEIFFHDPNVDHDRIAIYGVSRGAMTVAQIITHNKYKFAASILEVGAYDFEKFYNDPKTPQEVKDKIKEETNGASNEELQERSSIHNMKNIDAPVLILHGDKDERVPVTQAQLLSEVLKQFHKPHELVILENAGHRLARKGRYEHVFLFLKKHLT